MDGSLVEAELAEDRHCVLALAGGARGRPRWGLVELDRTRHEEPAGARGVGNEVLVGSDLGIREDLGR